MNVSQLKQSQFLKKEDVGAGILVTIRDCTEENVAVPGATPDMKWALHFEEVDKPLILNQTNGDSIHSITGSPESDDWMGHKIVLYTDPSIKFQGKTVGGIRVRAPRGQATAKPKQSPARPAPRPAPTRAPISVEPEPETDPARDDDAVPF